MRVLCLTHEHDGPAGLFADVVRERGDELSSGRLAGPPPEAPESFDALVVFGGSMHVDQEDRHPWLTGQHDLMREALDRGQPLMGVCLGGQLLARVAGAQWAPPRARRSAGSRRAHARRRIRPRGRLLPERFEAFEWQRFAFTSLPTGSSWGRAGLCAGLPGRRGGLGVHFHPEVTHEMLEAWRAAADGSAPPVPLEPVGRWNELGRVLANAFFDQASR